MTEEITIFFQIIFIDLILAGDNAIIIGMVASKFPPEQRKKIIFWGIGGAVILRILLTLITAYLLQITGLRLLGGLLLLYIVYKLYIDVIKNWLSDLQNITAIGRSGMFKYNNQDHAMATGLYAARTLLGHGEFDPWEVNVDGEYHEEVTNN